MERNKRDMIKNRHQMSILEKNLVQKALNFVTMLAHHETNENLDRNPHQGL
jgi:RAB protein geranylgeranyltransferase component A